MMGSMKWQEAEIQTRFAARSRRFGSRLVHLPEYRLAESPFAELVQKADEGSAGNVADWRVV